MTRQADSHRKTPLLEWIAGSLGLMLLIGMLSIIGYDALSGASRAPAVVVVKTGKVARAGDGFVVEPGFKGTWKIEQPVRKHFCIKLK